MLNGKRDTEFFVNFAPDCFIECFVAFNSTAEDRPAARVKDARRMVALLE